MFLVVVWGASEIAATASTLLRWLARKVEDHLGRLSRNGRDRVGVIGRRWGTLSVFVM